MNIIRAIAEKIKGAFGQPKTNQAWWGKPEENPFVTKTPTPSPTPAPFRFDFSNPNYVDIPKTVNLDQPPIDIAKAIRSVFEPRGEATQAAAVAAAEHLNQPWATNLIGGPNIDYNRSKDYGLFQVNSNTFNDLWQRRPEQMKKIGAYTLKDLFDPVKNAKVAELIRMDEEWSGVRPWSRWYGWQDKNWNIK